MRTNADFNRMLDKIAETNPARFETPSLQRAETSRSSAPRLAEPSSVEKKKKTDDAETDSRPFAPRLAADSDALATPTPRSARPRRQTPSSSLPSLASLRPSDERVKKEKGAPTVKSSSFDAEKRAAKEVDEENKRTQRRRQIDPTTCERDYSTDEIEFMKALDDYKRASGRMFPTCSEILEVFKSLGYVKSTRSETTDDSSKPNARPNRVATPAFLSDEENETLDFDDAPVLGIA
jgi:hypothetical protein